MRPMVIGACYAEPCDTNRMKGAPLEPTDTGTALGFRLVTDEGTQHIRGGDWGFDSSYAQAGHRGGDAPSYSHRSIGFRLCVDWGK